MAFDRFNALIQEYDMIPPGAKVLCAVSGGADSVCLLHMLSQRKDISLAAAHFNHQLRGEESDRDEAFVRKLCEAWHIPCEIGGGDVAAETKARKQGIEETALQMRYAFLHETAEALGGALIATAHNADDNAETILFNLIRGTGLHGLTGIAPMRGNLIRPLLNCSRQDIEEYLQVHDLPHVEDSSNTDETYSRNRIRHQVIPVLQEINSKAIEHIGSTVRQLSEIDQAIEAQARKYTKQVTVQNGRLEFPFFNYRCVPSELLSRMLLQLLDKLGTGRKDISAEHLRALQYMMMHSRYRYESRMDLPHGVVARCYWNTLILESRPQKWTELQLIAHFPVRWGNYTLILLDQPDGNGLSIRAPAEPSAAVTVGPCPPAQRLTLSGSNGARTIKRLCLDKGIGLTERDTLPAFFVDGRLAAVWPLGVDLEFQPENGKDRRFIQIQHTEENGK